MSPVAAACAGAAPLKRKLSSLSSPSLPPPYPLLPAPAPVLPPATSDAPAPPPPPAAARPSPHKRRRHIHDLALRSRAEWFANLTCYLWYAPPTALHPRLPSPEPVARPSSLGTMHPPPCGADLMPAGIASPLHFADTQSQRLYPAPAFITFVHKILRTTQLSTSIVLVALYYLHRFKASQPHLACAPGSEYRAAIVSLMLANKYLDDNTYTSKTWSEVSNIPLTSLTKAEMELWRGLGLTVHVPADQFDLWSHQLQNITAERRDVCLRQQHHAADTRIATARRLSPSQPDSGYCLRSHTSRAMRERLSPLRSRSVGRVCSSLSPPRNWEAATAQPVQGMTLPPQPASIPSPYATRNPSAGSPSSIWEATSTISTTPSTAPLSDGPASSLLSPAYSSLAPFPSQAPAFSTSPSYPPLASAPMPEWPDKTVRCLSNEGIGYAPAPQHVPTNGLGITGYAPAESTRAHTSYPVVGTVGAVPIPSDRSYFSMGTPLRSPRTLVAPAYGVQAREPEALAYYQLASGSLFGIRSYFVPSPYRTPMPTSRASTPSFGYPLQPYTPPQWGRMEAPLPGACELAPAPTVTQPVRLQRPVGQEPFNNAPQPDAWPAFAASLRVSPARPF